MPTITSSAAQDVIVDALTQRDVSGGDAEIQAVHLVEADLRGHGSHGLQRLPVIAGRLDAGLTDPRAAPRIELHTATAFTVHGERSLGPIAAATAVAAARERAREHGLALAAIRDCGHLGMLAPYVEELADAGLVGIMTSISEALVHPLGGRRALIGTNPIAFGIPTTGDSFVFDMATSATSMGEVLQRGAAGLRLEPGVAVDAEGNPTTDPEAAAGGALSPFGGYKGFGLGLALEMLVALLTRSAIGTDVKGTLDFDHLCNKGDLLLVVDPSRFAASSASLDTVTDYLDLIAREITPSGLTTPGARSRRLRAERLAAGYDVPASLWDVVIPALVGRAEVGA